MTTEKNAMNEARTTTALVEVHPEIDGTVIALKKEAETILAYAEKRVVANNEEVALATEDLSGLANLRKAIEARRKNYTIPLDDYKKAILEFFKQLSDPLDKADRLTRDKVLAYRQRVMAERAEAEAIEQAKLDLAKREEALTGEHTIDLTPIERPTVVPSHVMTDVGSLGTKKVWQFEVVDFASLPDEYKLPDLVKIRKVVTAGVKILGVKSWQEAALVIRAK